MASGQRGSRNNLLAGLFLLVCLVLTVASVLVLSDLRERLESTRGYTVRFSLSEGAKGLQKGSAVLVGGLQAGRVEKVFYDRAGDGRVTGVNVEVEIDSDITLYDDALVVLELPLLGTVSNINIPSVGSSGSPVPEGGRLAGMLGGPSFLEQAGFGDEQRRQVQTILANATDVTSDLRTLTRKINPEFDEAAEKVQGTLDDVRFVSAGAREAWGGWRGRLDSALRAADAGAVRLEATIEQASARVEQVREVIATVQGMLDENRPVIARSVGNVETITERVRDRTLEQVSELLEGGRRAVARFETVGEEAVAVLGDAGPELRLALANARLASDQLKLTLTEVRRNPWRVFYQPTRKELEQELLYDSARTYAEAVSDLRAASATLEQLTRGGGAGASSALSEADRRQVESTLEEIESAFERYRQAERDFLDRLIERPG